MKSSYFCPVLPLASSASLNRMLAQAKAYVVHWKKALALENLVRSIAVELMGRAGTHVYCDWKVAGYDDTRWLAWKVMGVAAGLARVACDAFSWTTSLELSFSVLRVLIRASLTILPKDSSPRNSWFNEIIVIHEQTAMWHVNVFFLTCKHYLLVILTSLKERETLWKGAKLTKWYWGYRF